MKKPYEKPELMGLEALTGPGQGGGGGHGGGGGGSSSGHGGGHGQGRTCCRRTGHACPTLIRRSFGKRKKNKTAS